MDIVKFMVLCGLVLFAFGCGLNQLLWYYADLEWHKCYDKRSGLPEIQVPYQHKVQSINTTNYLINVLFLTYTYRQGGRMRLHMRIGR